MSRGVSRPLIKGSTTLDTSTEHWRDGRVAMDLNPETPLNPQPNNGIPPITFNPVILEGAGLGWPATFCQFSGAITTLSKPSSASSQIPAPMLPTASASSELPALPSPRFDSQSRPIFAACLAWTIIPQ
ncbi:hypothetical protein FRC00_014345 [Tulasnella sp. 408]|nr:hypothetical protein FRC00_014345 [Tulasnella sp. 408]